MRKLYLSSAFLSAFCLVLVCCKKDSRVEERPFFQFFNDAAITIDTTAQAADTWEYGFTFQPRKNGDITGLGIKLPATGDFKVTLWDLAGPAPVSLVSTLVHSSASHTESYLDISRVTLGKDHEYGISVIADAFYRLSRAGGGKFAFPRTTGHISIESFNEAINNSGTPNFPAAINDTRVAPCVDVIFIAD